MAINGTAQGRPPTAKQMRAEADRIKAQIELSQAKQTAKLYESIWFDDWNTGGDLWSRVRERDLDRNNWLPPSLPSDRRKGGNWPLWRTEFELDELRQKSRVLCKANSFAKGLLKNLTNYVIGKGFSYKAASKELLDSDPNTAGVQDPDSVKRLVAAVQNVVDQFCMRNRMGAMVDPMELEEVNTSRERELYRRVIRDGEAFVRFFFEDDGNTTIRVIEPEQVRNPPNVTWEMGWSYGIRHQISPEDVEKRLEYHAVYQDPTGQKPAGDTMTGELIDAAEVLHIKEPDEDSAIKRGTPAFTWDTLDAFNRAAKLQRNISMGSAIRAATAEIWEHQTATQAQVTDLASGLANFQRTNPVSGRNENFETIEPGTIRRLPPGQKLAQLPASMGAGTAENLSAVQGDLRMGSTAFSAPEYLTGDASNANYASTQEAGTPFVNNAGSEQEHFKTAFLCIIWKAVKHAVQSGNLPSEALKYVTIQAEAPTVMRQNEMEMAQTDQILVGLGVKDRQTCAMERGYDFELVQTNNQEYQDRFGQQGLPLPMPGDDPGQQLPVNDPTANDPPALAGLGESLDWLREAKDASGHEHAADGKFGTGGAAKTSTSTNPATKDEATETRFAKGMAHAKATIDGFKSKLAALTAKIDAHTNQLGVKQVKAMVGKALGVISTAQKKLYGVMEKRYGPKVAKGIFVAAQVTGSNPAIFPVWFVALPGSTLLAQVPLMGLAEGVLQAGRAGKAVGKLTGLLSSAEQELSDEEIDTLGEQLRTKLDSHFSEWLEANRDEVETALKSIPDEEGAERMQSAVESLESAGLADFTEMAKTEAANKNQMIIVPQADPFADKDKLTLLAEAIAQQLPQPTNPLTDPSNLAVLAELLVEKMNVTINMPEQPPAPAPVINLNPEIKVVMPLVDTVVERDATGKILGTRQTPAANQPSE